MNEEEILDQLIELNTALDMLILNVKELERNNPQPSAYFGQILKTLKKPIKTACEDNGGETPNTGCEGATSSCELQGDSDGMSFHEMTIKVDGVIYDGSVEIPNIKASGRRRPILEGGGYSWDYYLGLENISNQNVRIEFINYSGEGAGKQNENPTLQINTTTRSGTVCLAPRTPCLPTELPNIGNPIISGQQTLYYRVNQDQVKGVMSNPNGSAGFDTFLAQINGVEGRQFFTFSGGGLAAFRLMSGLVGARGDGSEPITITLMDLNGSSVVQSVFGVPLIELHACGFENFPGI